MQSTAVVPRPPCPADGHHVSSPWAPHFGAPPFLAAGTDTQERQAPSPGFGAERMSSNFACHTAVSVVTVTRSWESTATGTARWTGAGTGSWRVNPTMPSIASAPSSAAPSTRRSILPMMKEVPRSKERSGRADGDAAAAGGQVERARGGTVRRNADAAVPAVAGTRDAVRPAGHGQVDTAAVRLHLHVVRLRQR